MHELETLAQVLIWTAGSVCLAIVGMHASRRAFKPINIKANTDILAATVTIVGTLVSVVLGLLVSGSVDQYKQLENSVDSEAAAVADVFRDSCALPKNTANQIQTQFGGEAWLRNLRHAPYEEAKTALTKLAGVGAKVRNE